MAEYVDYSKLPRRELQALCKLHKIPANKTNIFMAESLDALLNNAPRQQEEFLEEEVPAPESPEVEKKVEKVRGKRVTKKALLAEPELDSLAGMLANSTLTCDVQEEMVEAEVVRPEVPAPTSPVVPVKVRRGRQRKTLKEHEVIEEPESGVPTSVQPDFTTALETNVNPFEIEVVEEPLQTNKGDDEEMQEEVEFNDHCIDSASAASLEADQSIPKPQAEEIPLVYGRVKSRRAKKVGTEFVEEPLQSNTVDGEEVEDTSCSADLASSFESVQSIPEAEDEEPPLVYGRLKSCRTKKMGKAERVLQTQPELTIEAPEMCDEGEDLDASTAAIVEKAEAPVRVKAPKTKKASKAEEKAEQEEEGSAAKPSLASRFAEVCNEVVVAEEVTEASPILKGKKVKKSKKASSKSRRHAEAVVEEEALIEVEDVKEEVSDNTFSWKCPPSVLEEEENLECAEEVTTPKKAAGQDEKENSGDALLSQSIRKLKVACKAKGLRTRVSNTRSMKI